MMKKERASHGSHSDPTRPDPTQNLAGSGQEVFEISRAGSGRVVVGQEVSKPRGVGLGRIVTP